MNSSGQAKLDAKNNPFNPEETAYQRRADRMGRVGRIQRDNMGTRYGSSGPAQPYDKPGIVATSRATAKSGDSLRKIVKAKTSGVGANKSYSSLLNPKTGKGGSVTYRQKPGYETTAQIKNSNKALTASTKLNKKK